MDIAQVRDNARNLKGALNTREFNLPGMSVDEYNNLLSGLETLSKAAEKASQDERVWVATVRIAFQDTPEIPNKEHASDYVSDGLMDILFREGGLLSWGYDFNPATGKWAYPVQREVPKDKEGYIEQEGILYYPGRQPYSEAV